VNAPLLAESCVTVTLVPPELVSVAACAALVPTRTFPNDSDAGLAISFPGATPRPDSATSISPLPAALLLIAMVPEGFPAPRGVNAIVNVVVWPGTSVKGIAGAVTWNEGSDEPSLDMVTEEAEPLVSVSVSCLLVPTTAVPKSSCALLTESVPFVLVEKDPPPSA
jgi:hypothetical protein